MWWYKFRFNGQLVRESSKSASLTVARDAVKARKHQLEEGFNGITKKHAGLLFSLASREWLDLKKPTLSPRSVQIEEANLKHLKPSFGGLLLGDINAQRIARYQQRRLNAGASPKTINLEVGTVRAILRRFRLWANVQPDVKLLKTRDDIGRALSDAEERALLEACLQSRSRSLYPAVVIALSTAMRYSEIRLLKWKQVDLAKKMLTVGDSKTEAGTGRFIPLNDRVLKVLNMWAGQFPTRTPEHYVFPFEKCGAAGNEFRPCVWGTDPTKPIGNWKEAWEAAKLRAAKILKGNPEEDPNEGHPKEHVDPLPCRFHDLRHTGCTRMLEAGAPFSVVAAVMGWSPSTAVRMAKRYGHIGQAAVREAVKALEGVDIGLHGAQNWAQSPTAQKEVRPN